MRCKKHITDHSSSIGVCSTCLRDRLFVIIAAQVQEDRRRRTDTITNNNNNPQLQFPRSVSPYISRRKSDGFKLDTWQNQHQQREGEGGGGGVDDQRFFSTPHVGPTGKIVDGVSKKKIGFGFSFSAVGLRSKPDDKPDLDVSGSDPERNGMETCTSVAAASRRWWFVKMIFGRRRKKSRTLSVDDPVVGGGRRIYRKGDKGMSPVRNSDFEDENWNHELSKSMPEWRETPKRTPVWIPPGKRGGHNRNGSGFGVCLSPLVRASPSRQWNQKGVGVSSELVVSGDMRVVPVKPSPSHPSAFCKNRSKKMADFGRCHHNR